jgi:hypothetical protein
LTGSGKHIRIENCKFSGVSSGIANAAYRGYEYEIYRTDEYTKLQSGMNILDEILENIRQGTPKPKKTLSITEA